MIFLALCLFLFFLTHTLSVFAPQQRARMIARFGDGPFKGLYSLVSVVTFGLVIYAFGEARQDTGMLWHPPVWTSHLAVTLMLPAMICLVASLLPAGRIVTKTRHPLILSVKIWALAHLLANGETASILLFASFLAWGVVMRISLKRRQRAGENVVRPFVSGRYDLAAIVGGVVLWGAFILKLHEWLIGVQPIVL